MNRIAIIPARGGSKRIPGKNTKDFLGKPIIAYSIQAALKSNLFDEVMVSTDDTEIADIARQYGASVPFIRNKITTGDYATTSEVLKEVIEKYAENNRHFDDGCCLYPTAPLVTPVKLVEAYDLLKKQNLDAVFPIVRYNYPILRSLKYANGKVQMNWPEYLNSRSQDLAPAFYDSGQFYWFNINQFIETNEIITNNCGGIEISEIEAQDIDNDIDWQLAEMKYNLVNSN